MHKLALARWEAVERDTLLSEPCRKLHSVATPIATPPRGLKGAAVTTDPNLHERMLELLTKPNKTAAENGELSKYFRLDLIALGMPVPPGTPKLPLTLLPAFGPRPTPQNRPQKQGPGRTGRKKRRKARK